MVNQALEEEKQKFQVKQNQLESDLQNRVEKVLKLEMELDETREAYKSLE